jgi:hypothetical protein
MLDIGLFIFTTGRAFRLDNSPLNVEWVGGVRGPGHIFYSLFNKGQESDEKNAEKTLKARRRKI